MPTLQDQSLKIPKWKRKCPKLGSQIDVLAAYNEVKALMDAEYQREKAEGKRSVIREVA